MPDNTILLPGGGGDTIRTEEIAGAKFPVSKIVLGDVDVDDGDVSIRNPLPVTEAVQSPQVSAGIAVGITPGGQGSIDSDQITSGKVGKLISVLVTGSAPFKADLRIVSNGAAGLSQGIACPIDRVWDWRTPARDFVKVAENAGGGFDGFRIVVTNLDTGFIPSDYYCTFFFDEV